jgi:two-component system cell cycle response regulator
MSLRVLAVDGNRTSLDLVVYLLRAFGYEVRGFNRPLQALESLKNERYDLALVDMLMPEIDGFEFAKRVRTDQQLKPIPLIAVTVLAMVGDRERILDAGFDGYITKPIDPQRFVSQLQHLYARAGDTTTAPERRRTPLVLVVDDVAINRQVIRGTLSPFGYRIAEAADAIEAYEQIRRQRPALILCDVHMPRGDGFSLVETVKTDADLRSIPFIFISSTAWQTKDKHRATELGAQKFILRPIEPQALLNEVRTAIKAGNAAAERRGRAQGLIT